MKTPTQIPRQQDLESAQAPRALDVRSPPQAICDWFRRLASEGHASHLVGECVLQLALGLSPTHYRAHSSISRDALLSLAPRAIPTGVASGAITIATVAGPLDVLPGHAGDEAQSDRKPSSFAILNLAFDPLRGDTIAPPQALRDIACRTLNPSDAAAPCSDPAFALEAARLVATYGFAASASLLDRARKTRFEVTAREHPRLRRLLRETLLAPHASAGLAFLRDSGAEAVLVSGVRAEASALVARVPPELRLRLGAWLLGADAKGLLRALRFGSQLSAELYRLFDHHPIDQCVAPSHDTQVRKLLGRLSQAEIADLLALRRAEAEVLRETDQPAEADRVLLGLERMLEAFVRVREQQRRRERRARLAISGAQVMQLLGCEPGPVVGRAIRFLERAIEANPDINTPEALSAELDRWRDVR